VAPNQFEFAPIFEEANLANDHNQLVMDLMKRIARKHHFQVLLHEKPFASVNGSGKHNNWSLCTDTGVNLFSPAKNPKGNMLFITFLVNVMAAVYKHQDLLRASIMNAGNVYRLGANEAPPAILSVFLGQNLSNMLDNLVEKVGDNKMTPEEKTALKLGIARIPDIMLDNTDRNRTSPFAFTGNRFEFRAVGSSANCAASIIALNAAVAHQLTLFKSEVDALIAKGKGKDESIFKVLKKLIVESKPVRFEGDGYSEEWRLEAEKRGLTNITSAPEAIGKYLSDSSKEVLIGMGVFNEVELKGRVEVEYEKFSKKVQIESRILGDLAINHIVPTAVSYQNRLIENLCGLKQLFDSEEFDELAADRKDLIREISRHVTAIKKLSKRMIDERYQANTSSSEMRKAELYDSTVRPTMIELRAHIDELELVIDDDIWPLPKYRELLFAK
jgi:glutamine synthetase